MKVPLRGSDVRRRYSLRYTSRSTSHESSAHAEAMYEGDTPYGAPH